MDQIELLTIFASAQRYGLKTKVSTARFLVQAKSVEDWHLRIKYIAVWSGSPEEIPAETWAYLNHDATVKALALELGVERSPVPGPKVEHIEVLTLDEWKALGLSR